MKGQVAAHYHRRCRRFLAVPNDDCTFETAPWNFTECRGANRQARNHCNNYLELHFGLSSLLLRILSHSLPSISSIHVSEGCLGHCPRFSHALGILPRHSFGYMANSNSSCFTSEPSRFPEGSEYLLIKWASPPRISHDRCLCHRIYLVQYN